MPIAFLPALKWLGAAFWDFASSRMGQIVIAFAVAWVWSGHNTDQEWQAKVAREQAAAVAALKAEAARQAEAAREIAEAATARAEEDDAAMAAMREKIAEFDAKEKSVAPLPRTIFKTVPAGACVIDDDFARVVRGIDAAGSKTKASRRPRGVR